MSFQNMRTLMNKYVFGRWAIWAILSFVLLFPRTIASPSLREEQPTKSREIALTSTNSNDSNISYHRVLKDKKKMEWIDYPEEYIDMKRIHRLLESSRNDTRMKIVNDTLKAAAGLYNDKEKGRKAGLDKTVFTILLAYDTSGIFYYKVFFQNFLCFTKHYDIDLVVYIVHHHLADIEGEIEMLTSLGVKVLTYPDEKFWSLIATKKTTISRNGPERAHYEGDYPTFKEFGALVMLVPLLEVLELGYNAIYFDIDIGLVQDPIPYLLTGDADFVTSYEIRQCPEIWPTLSGSAYPWDGVEANTGVMHVRATPQGKSFYRQWLERIVANNMINDQKVLEWSKFHAHYTPNCNWNTSAYPTVRPSPDTPTYCILSELLFQNGLAAFTCSTKQAYRDHWYTGMSKLGLSNVVVGKYLPVTVHANYCNGKAHELSVRGLWLYDDTYGQRKSNSTSGNMTTSASASTNANANATASLGSSSTEVNGTTAHNIHHHHRGHRSRKDSGANVAYEDNICKVYRVNETWYATVDWTSELESIAKFRQQVFSNIMKNGTLIKRYSGKEVYILDGQLKRHVIPDIETFESLDLDWGQIKGIPTEMLARIEEGPPIPSVKNNKPKN